MMLVRRSLAAIGLGLIASLAPVGAALRPTVAPALLYRLHVIRRGLGAGALALAAANAFAHPTRGQIGAIPFTALAAVGAWIYPTRVFVTLDRPGRVGAAEADVAPEETVLGCADGSAAVAWPLGILKPHHLINDVVGDRPLLVTYCPLCRTAIAFDAVVRGQALTFEVSWLIRGNMLMRDRETGSIWQQATGEALAGPLAGECLTICLAEQTTWAAWRADYPETQVCAKPSLASLGIIQLLPFDGMTGRFGRASFILPGFHSADSRLPSRVEVAGVAIDGDARAYPLTAGRSSVVADSLGGVSLVVSYDHKVDNVRAFAAPDGRHAALAVEGDAIVARGGSGRWSLRGEPLVAGVASLERLPVARQWWMSWVEFHPETSVYAE
jgi:hypothetical protein